MVSYTTHRIPNMFVWMLRQETWLRLQLQRWIVRSAQQRAFQHFARRYPHWADSLFDDFFLTHAAAPLIAGYLIPYHRPTAVELANAWAAQCPEPRSSTQPLDLTEATHVAAAFLRMLDAELEPYQSLLF